MKNVRNLKKLMLYVGALFLVFGFNSCSDDDDGTPIVQATGMIQVDDQQTLSGNTLTVQNVTVGQDSWLAAVSVGDENTNNFIAQPVSVQEGTNSNVQLTFDENAITDDGSGQQVVLKLYADNQTSGTQGQWDASDEPIKDNNVLVTETITVFAESSGTAAFADFDTNADGSLDVNEVPATYQNNFTEWDADGDGSLSSAEFYNTTFFNTDADNDDAVSEEEWNTGFAGMFGNWSNDDFATFDADADGMLSSDEWNQVFAESQWFETYDADADTFVTEDEWDAGLFGDWDTNDDNIIDENEFNIYSPYVATW